MRTLGPRLRFRLLAGFLLIIGLDFADKLLEAAKNKYPEIEFISGDIRLPADWRDIIREAGNDVYLSVVSLWEAIIKHHCNF